jgi:transcriptional regulator of acetoin/glycerol metabolism
MQSPSRYRQYAQECERIARQSAPQQRAVLLEIAEAWRRCAEDAEQHENAEAPQPTDGNAIAP